MYFKTTKIIISALVLLLSISCGDKNSEATVDVAADDRESFVQATDDDKSYSSRSRRSSCSLSRLCDEYERYTEEFKGAINSGDFESLDSIQKKIESWTAKWEKELNSGSCTEAEAMDATRRLASIVDSLMNS